MLRNSDKFALLNLVEENGSLTIDLALNVYLVYDSKEAWMRDLFLQLNFNYIEVLIYCLWMRRYHPLRW